MNVYNRLQRGVQSFSIGSICNTYTEPTMDLHPLPSFHKKWSANLPVEGILYTCLVEAIGEDKARDAYKEAVRKYESWYEETSHYSLAFERTPEWNTRVILFEHSNNGVVLVEDIAEFHDPDDNDQLRDWIRDWINDDHHIELPIRLRFDGNELVVADPITTGIFLMSQKKD